MDETHVSKHGRDDDVLGNKTVIPEMIVLIRDIQSEGSWRLCQETNGGKQSILANVITNSRTQPDCNLLQLRLITVTSSPALIHHFQIISRYTF